MPLRPVIENRRLRACAIHGLISLGALLLVVCPLLLRWYPPPLFADYAGWQVPGLLAIALLVSGPLLTLIVFRPAKPRHLIRFDLACIAVIQTTLLAYGLHSLHAGRPVVLAYWNGVVYPITSQELAPQAVPAATLRRLGPIRPPLVYVRKPKDRDEVAAMLNYGFNHGLAEPSLAFLYEPLTDRLDRLFAASVEHRNDARPDWLQARREYLRSRPTAGALAFIPFAGRDGQRLVVIDRRGRVIETLALTAAAASAP